jgi:coiled-coil domain-containing protein 130
MEKMANDAFFKLEHGVQDQRKATETVPVLTQLQRLNDAQWRDPYTQSQQLRRKFRDQKKIDKANQEKKDKLRDKMSLHIDLVDEHPDDDIRAKLTEFAGKRKE